MAVHSSRNEPQSPDSLVEHPMTDLNIEEKGNPEPVSEEKPSGRKEATPSEHTTIADRHEGDDHGEPDLERTATRRAPIVKVSRSERRGLLARFSLVPEVTVPEDYDYKVKWFIT